MKLQLNTLVFALSCNSFLVHEVEAGYFTNSGLINQVRAGHTATLLTNGQVLITGGNSGIVTLPDAELYNPANGTWTFSGSMTNARGGHTATLLLDGQLLVAGGTQYSSNLFTAELYNPITGTWTPTGPLATARWGHTATLLSNGQVLVAGGWGDDQGNPRLSSAEIYDPNAGTWSNTGAMNLARVRHTATLLANGQVLVAGGEGNGTSATPYFSSAELYHPDTRTWTYTGSMTTNRELHTATLLTNGLVLVAGGSGSVPGLHSSTELYDPNNGSWTNTGAMTTGRLLHTATLLANGKVLIAGGGGDASPYVLSSAEVYDPSMRAWTTTGSLNGTRINHTATLLPNGKVLIAGGLNHLNQYLYISELYDDFDSIILTSVMMLPSGGFQFGFTHTGGFNFSALSTTNIALPLSNWTVLGSVTEISPGQFQFTDSQATNYAQRFYRVRVN